MANERMKELENMNSRVYITRKVKKKNQPLKHWDRKLDEKLPEV